MGHLETYLQEHNEQLWLALGQVRRAAEAIWKVPLHRHYTDHTVDHSRRVIEKLDGLTAGIMERPGQRLAPAEVYVLLAAAYLHDIGMQDERCRGGKLEEIRAHHHERSAEMIIGSVRDRSRYPDLGLDEDPTLVHLVALVAKGHRQVDLGAPEYDPVACGDDVIRPRLLGALLRFADELDIDHRRVYMDRLKVLQADLPTYFHWYRCYYVSGVEVRDEYIKIHYRFPEERYEDLIRPLVEDEVRTKFAAVEDILREGGIRAAIGPSRSTVIAIVNPMPPPLLGYVRDVVASKERDRLAEMQRRIEIVKDRDPEHRPFYLAEADIQRTEEQIASLRDTPAEASTQELRDIYARVYDIYSATAVGFVNREDEIRFLTQFDGPEFVLVTAPAGLGKTYLLRMVERYLRLPLSPEWVVTRCDLAGNGQAAEATVEQIMEQLGAVAASYPRAEDRLVRAVERACQETPNTVGAILLLDGVEWLPADVAASLKELLTEASSRLYREGLRLRTILAMRYCSGVWEGWGYEFALTPFTTAVIAKAIQQMRRRQGLPLLDRHACSILASEMRWVSGGHPRAMVGILDELSQDKFRSIGAELAEAAQDRPSGVRGRDSARPPEAQPSDTLARYEAGLDALLERIGRGHPRHAEALVYQQRLVENIAQVRRYGETADSRVERSRVIERLNELALTVSDLSFNDLCRPVPPAGETMPGRPIPRVQVSADLLRHWFQKHVRPLIPDLLDGVPEELHGPLRAASVFRWVTAEVLDLLLAAEKVKACSSGAELLTRMAATHLVRPPGWNEPGYSDEVVWSVLRAEMFFENPRRFLALNGQAWLVHTHWLDDRDVIGQPLPRAGGLLEQLSSLRELAYHALLVGLGQVTLWEQLKQYVALFGERFGPEGESQARRLLSGLPSTDEDLQWAARRAAVDLSALLGGTG